MSTPSPNTISSHIAIRPDWLGKRREAALAGRDWNLRPSRARPDLDRRPEGAGRQTCDPVSAAHSHG